MGGDVAVGIMRVGVGDAALGRVGSVVEGAREVAAGAGSAGLHAPINTARKAQAADAVGKRCFRACSLGPAVRPLI